MAECHGVTHDDWQNFTSNLTTVRNGDNIKSAFGLNPSLENQLQRMREVLAT